ncbi:MAG: hypothetical protein HQ582_05530 [Planctomycetes bacterium]|nr:hypothetical protein [Planctomycetota bacterium]
MSRDFYELCYDQYKHEMDEAQSLYQKAQLMIIVIPLLGAITVRLGRLDILDLCFVRVDAFLFYLAVVVSFAALVATVVFLFRCVCPRDYATLATMNVWQKWREDYQVYREDPRNNDSDSQSLDMAMFQRICPRLAEAQPLNAEINEKRRKSFKRSIQMSAVTLAAIGVEAFFALMLELQGV